MSGGLAIVGARLVLPPPLQGEEGCLAIVTIEWGPISIGGLRLYRDGAGVTFFRAPRMRSVEDHVCLRQGPERDALLVEARAIVARLQDARRRVPPVELHRVEAAGSQAAP